MAARSAAERREDLVALYHRLRDCHDCPLKATRTKLVFGAGNANAEVMFVGEAPGAEEDRTGLPFVGRAGKLLNELLEEIGLSRDDVFINNVLMCRPPGNRDPLPDEIAECEPHLHRADPPDPAQGDLHARQLRHQAADRPARPASRAAAAIPQYREIAGSGRPLPAVPPGRGAAHPATKEKLRADMARLPELIEAQRPRQEAALAERRREPGSEPAAAARPVRLARCRRARPRRCRRPRAARACRSAGGCAARRRWGRRRSAGARRASSGGRRWR